MLKSSIFVDPYHEKLHYGGQLAHYGCSRNRDNLSFDADLRLWNSEKFSCHGPDGLIHTSGHYGGFISGTMYYRLPVNREKGYRFYISAGFALKTAGYTRGYPLAGGFRMNVGLGYALQVPVRPGAVQRFNQ